MSASTSELNIKYVIYVKSIPLTWSQEKVDGLMELKSHTYTPD